MLALLLAGVVRAEPMSIPPSVSPAVAAFVAAVHDAYARVRAEQAKAPPETDRRRLEQLVELDQAGREPLAQLDVEHLNETDRRAAQPGLDEIRAQDLANRSQLRSMIPPTGWFTRRAYGRKAALGAWLVVDHAVDDPALMRMVLARLKPLASAGGFEGRQYAIMFDRMALVIDHLPQRYGTQVTCQGGAWRALNVDRPAAIDRRRRAVGFTQTEAAYLKSFSDPCR